MTGIFFFWKSGWELYVKGVVEIMVDRMFIDLECLFGNLKAMFLSK